MDNGDLLTLLSMAISALRQSAVDDLHPAGHYAEMLEHLAQKAEDRSRVAHERPDVGNTTLPDDVDHVEQPRSGAAPACGEYLPVENIDSNVPDNWDEWLAFQLDPTFTSVGDLDLTGTIQI